MTEKRTIVDKYAEVKAFLEENNADEEMINFIVERSDSHAKKTANRKPTKTQEENNAIKVDIIEAMEEGKQYTATQIQKLLEVEYPFNKINAIIRQMVKNDLTIDRAEVKGRAYFSKIV